MQIHELDKYTGSLGSEAYLAIDNGTDTGKLSTEDLLSNAYESIDELGTTLSKRIDNIIAGGTAPSAAEIVDARLGANGTVYPSLGDAIRAQVEELQDDVNPTANYPLLSGYYHQNNSQMLNDATASDNFKTTVLRVLPGEIYEICGSGTNTARLWSTSNNAGQLIRIAAASTDSTREPVQITIEEGEEFLCFNTQETVFDEYVKCVNGNLIQNNREQFAEQKTSGEISSTNDYAVINLFDLQHSVQKRSGYFNYKDFLNVYKQHSFSYGFQGLSDLTAEHELYLTFAQPIVLDGTQEFVLLVHSDIDSTVSFRLVFTKSGGSTLTLDNSTAIKTGWNRIRFKTYVANFSNWTNDKNVVRIMVRSNPDSAALLFGALYQVKPPKGKIIVTDDHAYYGYLEYAYPLLSALGVPTTWGVRISRIGQTVDGGTRQINAEEIETLAGEANSEFSFHSWDGTATSDMSETELRNRIQRCLYWLRKNGLLQKYFWRSACVQNRAPAMANIKDMLNDCATYDTAYTLTSFPFENRLNIPRIAIHGASTASIDNFFNALEKTHCTAVFYTHDVIDDGTGTVHASKNEIDYFVSKVQAGINGGWLEGTTINRLYTKYGLYFDPIDNRK